MLGALPVLGGERIDRDHFHADVATVADDLLEGLRAVHMPVLARHGALFRPSAVAVHDERDMREPLVHFRVRFGGLVFAE